MKDCDNILVVIQNDEEAKAVLRKVKILATMENSRVKTQVHVVRVAWEGLADHDVKDVDASTELKNFILQAEAQALKDAIATSGVAIDGIESTTLWGRKQWEIILHAAETVNADLIVKAEARADKLRFVRTPSDWNLLRHSRIPVLLCDATEWSVVPKLVAAVDTFDPEHEKLNSRILQTADQLAAGLHGRLDVVTAFPSLDPWTPNMNTFGNYQKMMEEVEQDAVRRLHALQDKENLGKHRSRALEGSVEAVIKRVTNEESTDLLILGTTGRAGIEGVLIGNTAEQILHETTTDVLTVS